jgi:uncharacterized protein (TIGR02147 family)
MLLLELKSAPSVCNMPSMQSEILRELLNSELERRCEKNGRYSLRAFAKALGIEPGALSRILAGKRTPSPQTAEKILGVLDLSAEERNKLFGKSTLKQNRSTEAQRPKELSLDVFRIIADLYHYAILQLPFTKLNTSRSRDIASLFGLGVTEARLAVSRLVNLGLLEVKDGKLVRTNEKLMTADRHLTTSAHKRHQKQSLSLAIDAIDNIAIEKRDMTSMTCAIDERHIPEAKKRIAEFVGSLSEFMEEGSGRQIYQMGFYLYPLQKTKVQKK